MKHALWILAAALATGCPLISPSQTVRLEIPAPPEPWRQLFAAADCELVWVSGAGIVRRASVAGWPAAVALDVDARQASPVLAYPLWQAYRLRPAGAAVDPGVMEAHASWQGGSGCEVLLALRRQNVSNVDSRRLLAAIENLADPWALDTTHLLEAVTAGTLRVTDVRALPHVEAAVALTPGTWCWDSPLRPTLLAGADPVDLSLPLGLHRLFHTETAAVITLWADSRGILIHR